mmetsp:Transcript_48606/g.89291  ORF Transcript_48606/g.89291 Transcript_48606/m.89291 type:complete len:468 (+) Transcript_48606:40-1443(+)
MADIAAKLKSIFSDLDRDKNLTISRSQLKAVLQCMDPTLTQADLDGIFDCVDKNGNNKIEYNEFLDFIFELQQDDGQAPPKGTPRQLLTPRSTGAKKLFDISRWQKALNSDSSTLAFHCDEQASVMHCLIREFPAFDFHSPEGLTLAEEFALIWQEDMSGKFDEYGYFGADEAFHNALFGACLLGLKARGLLHFKQRKCRHFGNYFQLLLSDAPPNDSEILKAVYEELDATPTFTLKDWFEEKSGKWGQDNTTQLVVQSLVQRGILEEGSYGDALTKTHFHTKDHEIEAAIKRRLRAVITGEITGDNRSVALLALCRIADLRDISTDTMVENMFGKDHAKTMAKQVDLLLKKTCNVGGCLITEELNKMFDHLPSHMQDYLASEEFTKNAIAKFRSMDKDSSGCLSPEEVAANIKECMPQELIDKLGVRSDCLAKIIPMFGVDPDGKVKEEGFIGFSMWCETLRILGA